MSERSLNARRVLRWRVYLQLGRVSNLPTVWTNTLAGLILAGGTPQTQTLLPLVASLTFFYTGGMFLNDAFDHRYDREIRPERPIPSGSIGAAEVYALGFLQLALGEALLALPALTAGAPPAPEAMLGGLALGLVIVYYNYRHKSDPLSPLVMALCRALVYFVAAATVATAFSRPVLYGMAVLSCYLIGLTYAAKQENLQAVKNLWPLLFLAAPFLYAWPVVGRLSWESLLFVGLLCWVVYAVSFLVRREGRNIPHAVVSLIAGISLLDGVLIARIGGPPVWIVAALAGFALTLFFQRYISGT